MGKVLLFERCNKKELAAVAALTTEVTVESGRILCEEGGLGTEFFVVLEGTATVVQRGTPTQRLGPGQAFGETALLDAGLRTATVRAATPMTLLVLNPREFGALLERAPSVARKLLGTLAARVRKYEREIARLEQQVMKARAAARGA